MGAEFGLMTSGVLLCISAIPKTMDLMLILVSDILHAPPRKLEMGLTP